MEAFETLKQLVAAAEEDVIKIDRGNKAAGTRVRKMMQEIKAAAQDVRVKVLEAKQEVAPPSSLPPAQPPAQPPAL